MIKKLRQKFIVITMCSIALVLGSIIGIINIWNYKEVDEKAEELLSMIANNYGRFPETAYHRRHVKPKISPEAPYTTRYFSVVINKDGTIISINTGKIVAVSNSAAAKYTSGLFEQGKTAGFMKHYKYKRIDYLSDYMYIFLDCGMELSTFYSFFIVSVIVSMIGMLLVFILVVLFSKIVIKPVTEGYEKQKRFITDASHEIKTPLAIIDANAEVLEMEHGENEWTKSIKHQVQRLSVLTEKLIFLSKMDEENTVLSMEIFSLSEVISEAADSFETMAAAQGKALYQEIEGSISYYGNESTIRQLISILLENAVKYSNEKGIIVVSLWKSEKKVELMVKNTVNQIPQGNLDMLFERFYRLDHSRNSESGGYGIGLSVAKAIVTAHKGRITAKSDDGKTIIFSIILP